MRLTIQAGDVEIDLEGAAIQIDEQITHAKAEHTWTMMLEESRSEKAPWRPPSVAREAGLPERGSAFRALLENCALREADQCSAPFTTYATLRASATAPSRGQRTLCRRWH